MNYLRIRNWSKYQKIAGNKAPYIQVQTDILLDIEFMALPDRERLCFLLLLCLAGRTQNKLPADPHQIMYLCHFEDVPDLSLMMSRGLLEEWDEGKHRQALEKEEERKRYERQRKRQYRDKKACPDDVPAKSASETETETETETDKNILGDVPPDTKTAPTDEAFERLWSKRPRRTGNDPKRTAKRAFNARLKSGTSLADIEAGLERYTRYVKATGKEHTEFVMQFATFLGPSENYLQPWKLPKQGASLSHQNDDAIARALGVGNA